jgi:hypothetical protein
MQEKLFSDHQAGKSDKAAECFLLEYNERGPMARISSEAKGAGRL